MSEGSKNSGTLNVRQVGLRFGSNVKNLSNVSSSKKDPEETSNGLKIFIFLSVC